LEELIKTKDSFIRVKLFGMSKDLVGEKEITLPLTKVTVRELKLKLIEAYPSLTFRQVPFVFAVNNIIVNENTSVTYLDEIALLPPVCGG
jgi:molybdopterin converting factor small subunit